MDKNLKFTLNNPDSPLEQPLPKAMIKGRLACGNLVCGETAELEWLKTHRCIVNEDVDKIYQDIVSFFKSLGAVNITDRTPRSDGAMAVTFRISQATTLKQDDMRILEKIIFTYGNEFVIENTVGRKELTARFLLPGYYNVTEIGGV